MVLGIRFMQVKMNLFKKKVKPKFSRDQKRHALAKIEVIALTFQASFIRGS
jgi:hypothetical protein